VKSSEIAYQVGLSCFDQKGKSQGYRSECQASYLALFGKVWLYDEWLQIIELIVLKLIE